MPTAENKTKEEHLVEARIREVENAVLRMDSRLDNIDKNTTSMSEAISLLTAVHTHQKVLEERWEVRHAEAKQSHTVIHNRIDRIKANQNKGVWVVLTIFILGIGKLVMDGIPK